MKAEQEVERSHDQEAIARADRIFRNRMFTYFAKRYGEEMEIGPTVLWAIVHEHTAVELGEEFATIRGHVDDLLDAVEYIGDSSSAETCKLAQAYMILCRIVAGEPKDARTLRESLATAIDLVERAATPYRGADQVVLRGLPEHLRFHFGRP